MESSRDKFIPESKIKKYIVDGKEIEVDESKGETLEQKVTDLGVEPGREDDKKERRLVIEKDDF